MKILINGYYYGGNCPPFVYNLKKFNPDTKVTNALSILDEHGINLDYLKPSDILPIRLNLIEKIIVIFSKKARLPFWKTILIGKAKKVINNFQPDIIINHKASEKAEIMLRTNFRPQLTSIYGSEVHGTRIFRRVLDYIFNESLYILTTTNSMQAYLQEKRRAIKNKVVVYPLGNFDFDNIIKYKNENNLKKIREKYGIPLYETVVLDNRSLRGDYAGLFPIIDALKRNADQDLPIKMIILRGIGGTEHIIRKLNAIMKSDSTLSKQIIFINEVVNNERLFDYYYLSDAFISLLPSDQMGKCISDAMLFDCSLILSDLEIYRKRFGNGPCYIKDQSVDQLTDALTNLRKGRTYTVETNVYKSLLKISKPQIQFKNLYGFLNSILNETNTE